MRSPRFTSATPWQTRTAVKLGSLINCSVLELSMSLPLSRIHIRTNPLALPPTCAAAMTKKAPDSLNRTTPFSCLMFFDASVEFIVTTLGLVSLASCSSVLEA